jgi:hypothetical protein
MAKQVKVNSDNGTKASSVGMFYNDEGKLKWFDANPDSLTGSAAKAWDELVETWEATKLARVKFENEFYQSMQKAAKGGKLNDFPALEIGINQGYGVQFGYKWGKLSVSFDPAKKYVPGKASSGSKEKFSV